MNTGYKSTKIMNNDFQILKHKTKMSFHRNFISYYDKTGYRRQSGCFEFEKDPFAEKAQALGKMFHEVTILSSFLQRKPQLGSMNAKIFLCNKLLL